VNFDVPGALRRAQIDEHYDFAVSLADLLYHRSKYASHDAGKVTGDEIKALWMKHQKGTWIDTREEIEARQKPSIAPNGMSHVW
jgi:hypothetical protein